MRLLSDRVPAQTEFQLTPEFVARIRGELNEALALVGDAELRKAFETEMTRFYDAKDRRAEGG